MNLADWLKRRTGTTQEQLALVAAIAQAVEDGHKDGVQYAGWSPTQIQIRADGSVDLSALDSANRPKEDLAYTAPEAADNGPRTSRSDVYSSGVILYEVLAGKHPFGGLSVKQPRGAPKPLAELRRDLPKDLVDAVTACLERDPEWRPADLSYVLHVAQEAMSKTSGKAASRPAPVPVPSAPSGRRDTSPSFGARSTPAAASSSSKLPIIALGLVLLLAGAGAAAYFLVLKPKQDAPAPAPAPVAATPSPAPDAAATQTAEATPAPDAAATATATLPSVAEKRNTDAAPATTATAAPTAAMARPTAAPTTAVAASTPVATAAPTAIATSAPTEAPTQAPVAPAGPPALKSVSPPKVRRGTNALLDIRGENLRNGLEARFVHKGRDAGGLLIVVRQKLVDPELLQVLLTISSNAPTGPYMLSLSDGSTPSNALAFEIVQ